MKLLQDLNERMEKIEQINSSMHMEERMGLNDMNKLLQEIKVGITQNKAKDDRLKILAEEDDIHQIIQQDSNM